MQSEAISSSSSFAANVSRLVSQIEYRPIDSDAALESVLRLRYDAYLKEGAISPNERFQLNDSYDHLDNVVNVGLYFDGELVSALRMHFLSDADAISPSMHAFGDYLVPYLNAGHKIVDPNRFVVDYQMARKLPQLAYATTRLTMIAGTYYHARFAAISIRPEHQAFYRRTFFATLVCPPRPYPGLNKKLCLMLGDFAADSNRIIQRNAFYASTPAEQDMIFGKIKRGAALEAAAAA
ncbi:MAG: N-acyl amino acid synthase FeeM domain-containing protein [Methylovirgula sp.]